MSLFWTISKQLTKLSYKVLYIASHTWAASVQASVPFSCGTTTQLKANLVCHVFHLEKIVLEVRGESIVLCCIEKRDGKRKETRQSTSRSYNRTSNT